MPCEPLILGFDTSAAHCAAALLCGERVLAERCEPMEKGQAERLMPLLEQILAEGGAHWSDLAAIGVGTGPGNFTGIRIAVAAARGLALALDIPAIGVSGFEALAEGLPRPLLTSLDARRGGLYLHIVGGDTPPASATLETLPQQLAGSGLPVAGYRANELAPRTGGPVLTPPFALAVAIARRAGAQRGLPLPRPAPLYLRPADAAPAADPPPVILP